MAIVNKSKRVLVGGVFDILHYGHIHFLKSAKKLGDYLVVAIEPDARVKKLKGNTRPFHNQNQRREILESLSFVDEVIILKDEMTDADYLKLCQEVRPLYIAVTKGDPIIEKKKLHAKRVGAKIIEIEKINVPSTTQIAKLLKLE
jgi:FAD synthetase